MSALPQRKDLTDEQQAVAEAVVVERRNVAVNAVAGSGKTTTALAVALEFMTTHDRPVLFLVYNRKIKEETRQKVAQWPHEHRRRIVVENYHSLARNYFTTESEKRDGDIEAMISRAMKKRKPCKPLPEFGLVIFDEAQDLSTKSHLPFVSFVLEQLPQNCEAVVNERRFAQMKKRRTPLPPQLEEAFGLSPGTILNTAPAPPRTSKRARNDDDDAGDGRKSGTPPPEEEEDELDFIFRTGASPLSAGLVGESADGSPSTGKKKKGKSAAKSTASKSKTTKAKSKKGKKNDAATSEDEDDEASPARKSAGRSSASTKVRPLSKAEEDYLRFYDEYKAAVARRPQVLIIGDPFQQIYRYMDADSRALTEPDGYFAPLPIAVPQEFHPLIFRRFLGVEAAPGATTIGGVAGVSAFPSGKKNTMAGGDDDATSECPHRFVMLKLSICFRITHEMAAWINEKLNPKTFEKVRPEVWNEFSGFIEGWWGDGIQANPKLPPAPDSQVHFDFSKGGWTKPLEQTVAPLVKDLITEHGVDNTVFLARSVKRRSDNKSPAFTLMDSQALAEFDWFVEDSERADDSAAAVGGGAKGRFCPQPVIPIEKQTNEYGFSCVPHTAPAPAAAPGDPQGGAQGSRRREITYASGGAAADTADLVDGKVVLSTIHKFKGLERDVVIVVGVDDFYEAMAAKQSPAHHIDLFNLFYVACTRGVKKLITIQCNGPYATMRQPGQLSTNEGGGAAVRDYVEVTNLLKQVPFHPDIDRDGLQVDDETVAATADVVKDIRTIGGDSLRNVPPFEVLRTLYICIQQMCADPPRGAVNAVLQQVRSKINNAALTPESVLQTVDAAGARVIIGHLVSWNATPTPEPLCPFGLIDSPPELPSAEELVVTGWDALTAVTSTTCRALLLEVKPDAGSATVPELSALLSKVRYALEADAVPPQRRPDQSDDGAYFSQGGSMLSPVASLFASQDNSLSRPPPAAPAAQLPPAGLTGPALTSHPDTFNDPAFFHEPLFAQLLALGGDLHDSFAAAGTESSFLVSPATKLLTPHLPQPLIQTKAVVREDQMHIPLNRGSRRVLGRHPGTVEDISAIVGVATEYRLEAMLTGRVDIRPVTNMLKEIEYMGEMQGDGGKKRKVAKAIVEYVEGELPLIAMQYNDAPIDAPAEGGDADLGVNGRTARGGDCHQPRRYHHELRPWPWPELLRLALAHQVLQTESYYWWRQSVGGLEEYALRQVRFLESLSSNCARLLTSVLADAGITEAQATAAEDPPTKSKKSKKSKSAEASEHVSLTPEEVLLNTQNEGSIRYKFQVAQRYEMGPWFANHGVQGLLDLVVCRTEVLTPTQASFPEQTYPRVDDEEVVPDPAMFARPQRRLRPAEAVGMSQPGSQPLSQASQGQGQGRWMPEAVKRRKPTITRFTPSVSQQSQSREAPPTPPPPKPQPQALRSTDDVFHDTPWVDARPSRRHTVLIVELKTTAKSEHVQAMQCSAYVALFCLTVLGYPRSWRGPPLLDKDGFIVPPPAACLRHRTLEYLRKYDQELGLPNVDPNVASPLMAADATAASFSQEGGRDSAIHAAAEALMAVRQGDQHVSAVDALRRKKKELQCLLSVGRNVRVKGVCMYPLRGEVKQVLLRESPFDVLMRLCARYGKVNLTLETVEDAQFRLDREKQDKHQRESEREANRARERARAKRSREPSMSPPPAPMSQQARAACASQLLPGVGPSQPLSQQSVTSARPQYSMNGAASNGASTTNGASNGYGAAGWHTTTPPPSDEEEEGVLWRTPGNPNRAVGSAFSVQKLEASSQEEPTAMPGPSPVRFSKLSQASYQQRAAARADPARPSQGAANDPICL